MKKLLVLLFVAVMCIPGYANGADNVTLVYKFTRSFDPWVDYTNATQDVSSNIGTQQMTGYLVFNVDLETWGLNDDPNMVFYGGTGSNKWVTSFGVNDDVDDANANMDIHLFRVGTTDSNGLWFYVDANTEQEHVGASWCAVYGKTSKVDIGKGGGANRKDVPSSMKGIVEAWAEVVDSFYGLGSTTMALNTLYTQYANKTGSTHTQAQTVDKIMADLNTSGYRTAGSLQAQIDAALALRAGPPYTPLIIPVSAGTWYGDLVIDEPNVTLKSVSGKASTIIQLADGVGINIMGGADNFTLNGFTIDPNTAGGTTFAIQLTNAPTDVTITNNTIDIRTAEIPDCNMAISVGAAGAQGLTVSNNTILIGYGDGGIWGVDMVDASVLNNTFSGPTAHINSGYGVQFAGITGTSLINGNTLTNCNRGIFITGAQPGPSGTTIAENVTISYNTVKQCEKGIVLGHSSQTTNMKDMYVNRNTVQSNVVGLYVGNHATLIAADTFDCNTNNKFIDNTTYGVQNADGNTLPAENNWWGWRGPFHAGTNPTGLGNPVSDNVDYSPYRANSVMTYSVP